MRPQASGEENDIKKVEAGLSTRNFELEKEKSPERSEQPKVIKKESQSVYLVEAPEIKKNQNQSDTVDARKPE
mgnify:CR=1 FL=1|jgi:hypothetical protein